MKNHFFRSVDDKILILKRNNKKKIQKFVHLKNKLCIFVSFDISNF